MAWKPISLSLTALLALSSCVYHQNHAKGDYYVPDVNAARFNSQLTIGYLHRGEIGLAQEKLQIALKQAPEDPIVMDTAGYYYEKTGELDKANQYFNGALMLNPTSDVARNNYGAFLCRNGYINEADLFFNKAAQSRDSLTAISAQANHYYCTQKNQFMLGDNGIYAYYMAQMRYY